MTKKDIEKTKHQAELFKIKFGEYPKLPIRVRYRWMSQLCEGELKSSTGALFGYPGIVHVQDREVTEACFLYDGEGRLFPGITEDDCTTKPVKRG
jgi:hypothetical protein